MDRTPRSAASSLPSLAAAILLHATGPQAAEGLAALTVRGVLEAPTVEIASRCMEPTQVLEIAPEGTEVKKGDLVARLEDGRARSGLGAAEAEHEAARAEVEAARAEVEAARGTAAAEVKIAELAVDEARLALEGALGEGGDLDLALRLAEIEVATAKERVRIAATEAAFRDERQRVGTATPGDAMAASIALAEAKGGLEAAEARRKHLETSERKHRRAALELTIARKSAELERARAGLPAGETLGRAALIRAELRVRAAEVRRKSAEEDLAGTRVVAPFDGRVVRPAGSDAPAIGPGSSVRPGQTLLGLLAGDRSAWRVRAMAPGSAGVRVGARTTVAFDAFPDRVLAGRVTRADAVRSADGGEGLELVEIQLDEMPDGLRPGMTARAQIEASKRK